MISEQARKLKLFCLVSGIVAGVNFFAGGYTILVSSILFGFFVWSFILHFTTTISQRLLQKNASDENLSKKSVGSGFLFAAVGKFVIGVGLLILGLSKFSLNAAGIVGGALAFQTVFTGYSFWLASRSKKCFPDSKN